MVGNEDEWSPRVEPYTQEENDAEMEAVKSTTGPESAKMYDDKGWGSFVKTYINNMHIIPEDLQTNEGIERNTKLVLQKIFNDLGGKPGDYDLIKETIVKDLKRRSGEVTPDKKGPNYANPGKPADAKQTGKKVNESRFSVNRFVDNVRDNLLGM